MSLQDLVAEANEYRTGPTSFATDEAGIAALRRREEVLRVSAALLDALAPDAVALLIDMAEALRNQHTPECGTGYCGNDWEHCIPARALLARFAALNEKAGT